MAAILAQQMAQPDDDADDAGALQPAVPPNSPVPAAGGATPPPGGGKLGFALPDLRATLPPQYQPVFDRLVIAAKRVLYDPKTHAMMQRALARNLPMTQKLAEGVAALLLILFREAGGKVPPEVVIPAALDIVGEAAEYVAEVGMPIDQATYKQACALTAVIISKRFGIDPQALAQKPAPMAQPRSMLRGGPAAPATAQLAQPAAVGA